MLALGTWTMMVTFQISLHENLQLDWPWRIPGTIVCIFTYIYLPYKSSIHVTVNIGPIVPWASVMGSYEPLIQPGQVISNPFWAPPTADQEYLLDQPGGTQFFTSMPHGSQRVSINHPLGFIWHPERKVLVVVSKHPGEKQTTPGKTTQSFSMFESTIERLNSQRLEI